MRPISITVHGDVTRSIIDGPAIWLAALVQVLHRVDVEGVVEAVLDDPARWELARDRVVGAAADCDSERSAARLAPHVRWDLWAGHTTHDEAASQQLLARADVVVCERAVGNAVWCSRRVRPDQRLLVRLHRMELDTAFLADLAIDRVERVAREDARWRLHLGGPRLRERYPVEPVVAAWADLVLGGSRTGGHARAGVTRRARTHLRAGVAP